LLSDSAALDRALRIGLRADAFLLRFATDTDDPDTGTGSLLELLIMTAADAVENPSDTQRIDALLASRIGRLARAGVIPVLLARNAADASRPSVTAPVITMSIGLRRATLAMLSASSGRMTGAGGSTLLGIAQCRNDQQVARLARARGARYMPIAEQRGLCSRLRQSGATNPPRR
jgi:hypothetical protein